mgnify:CR=1 FL=1
MTTNDNLKELYKTKEELEKQLKKLNEKIKKEDELEKIHENNKLKEDIKIICEKFTYHHLQKYNLLMQCDLKHFIITVTHENDHNNIIYKKTYQTIEDLKDFLQTTCCPATKKREMFIKLLKIKNTLLNSNKYRLYNYNTGYQLILEKEKQITNTTKTYTQINISINCYQNKDEVTIDLYYVCKNSQLKLNKSSLINEFPNLEYDIIITDNYDYDEWSLTTQTEEVKETFSLTLGEINISNINHTITDTLEKFKQNSKLENLFN